MFASGLSAFILGVALIACFAGVRSGEFRSQPRWAEQLCSAGMLLLAGGGIFMGLSLLVALLRWSIRNLP